MSTATQYPTVTMACNAREFGAAGDGETIDTEALQRTIDAAAERGGAAVVPAGTYLTGSIFLKPGVRLHLDEGAVIRGVMDDVRYPQIHTRVAGVEMMWPAAVVNILKADGASITGEGIIDGQGEYWWRRFWGKDRHGGMLASYERRGLRWAVDFDCQRPRNVLVANSRHVTLSGFTSIRSGYWNIHVCYCDDVTIRRVSVRDNSGGPSTDGIDIDSSSNILVEGCVIDCEDDNICLKAGRNGDGVRVGRPCERITIRDCVLNHGYGLTIGSETTGGIHDVSISGIDFHGTRAGFRIKTTPMMGGTISDVTVSGLSMVNVKRPISWEFDWFPAYSLPSLENADRNAIPPHWPAIVSRTPERLRTPTARRIRVSGLRAIWDDGYCDESYALYIQGIEDGSRTVIDEVSFDGVSIQACRIGDIRHAGSIDMSDVSIAMARSPRSSESRPIIGSHGPETPAA